jgi:hypothetical protein
MIKSSTPQQISKSYSVWYYRWINDSTFKPDDPYEVHEKDYDLILEQIMNSNFEE